MWISPRIVASCERMNFFFFFYLCMRRMGVVVMQVVWFPPPPMFVLRTLCGSESPPVGMYALYVLRQELGRSE